MQTTTVYDKGLLENLLTNRQYAEALQYLDTLNVKKNCGLPREDIVRLYFAQGQCFYRLGDYRKAAVKVKCSIKIANPLNDNLLYARQKYTLGQIYFEIGRLDEALEEFSEASAFFRRVNDTPRLLAAQEMIALIHFHKGNLLSAIELNEATLPRVKGLGLIEHVKVVAFNLCRILLWTGDFARIRELLDTVADDCADPLNRTWLESLRGTLYVRVLDSGTAKKHLEKALTIARANCYRRDEVVCLEYLGLNEFYCGNYEEAKEYYEQILAMPEITASAVAQTSRLLTDAYVALGELDKAAETAVKAETAITKIKEWVELGCLHRALGLLADKRGDLAGATKHFDKAVEILSRHGARYELAVTYLTMGQTRCLAIDLKRERLQQAKALFAKMDVPKRVAQVEEVIVGLISIEPQPKIFRNSNNSIETPDIITQNAEMLRILAEAEKLADTGETVLITGETGVGKDLLAKRIHCRSPRSSRRFLSVSCPNLSETLLESRLFGHRRGAFSGAIRDEDGFFKVVEGGTLLLNEIGEVPDIIQSKLLEVIETKTMFRLGDSREFKVDVRLLAATNRDLQAQVLAGLFRRDLFYRLQDFHLHLPSLRERPEDLPLLVQHFLKQLDFADYDLQQSTLIVEQCDLAGYDWPGNVRELRGMLKKAVTLTPSRLLAELVGCLKIRMGQLSLIDFDNGERAKLVAALKRNSGCQTSAAKELGIPVSTLRNKLRKYRII